MANRRRNNGDEAVEEVMDSMVNNREAHRHISDAARSLSLAAYELGRQEQHLRGAAGHAERAARQLARLPVPA